MWFLIYIEEIFLKITNGANKGEKRETRFLHFSQTTEEMTPVECDLYHRHLYIDMIQIHWYNTNTHKCIYIIEQLLNSHMERYTHKQYR